MSNRSLRLPAALLILALLAPLLAACGGEDPTATPTRSAARATATPRPAAQKTSTPAADLPDRRNYTSPDLGFSADYPGAWRVDAVQAADNGVLFFPADGSAAFWVQARRFGGGAARANQAGIAFLKELNKGQAAAYAGEPAARQVAGLSGLSQDYRYTPAGKAAMQGTLIAVTSAEGETYLITLEARQADAGSVLPLLDAMLRSFRISAARAGAGTPSAAQPGQRAEAEWLVMFYEDADDSILERDMMVDFNEIERVGSTSQMHLVAQVDRYRGGFRGMGNWTTAKRFYITQDDDLGRIASPELADLGEVNMADGETLADFVTWAIVNYPARKHALILSDHGIGWPGGFSDADPGGPGKDKLALAAEMDDNIWLMELDRALEQVRSKTGLDKFELIGFDACLMGMLENYSILARHARYAVGSEELEPTLGWAYTDFLGRLAAKPGMNGADLGRAIVEGYIGQDQRIVDDTARSALLDENDMSSRLDAKSTAKEFSADVTLSAVNLAALPAVNTALDKLTVAMLALDRKKITAARTAAQTFENVFDPDTASPYIDLGHFVRLLRGGSGDAATNRAADELLAALKAAVIAERHGPERPAASGIAIYFPNRTIFRQESNWGYAAIVGRFATEHRWADFLAAHYGAKTAAQAAATKRSNLGGAYAVKPVQIAPLRLSAELASTGRPVTVSSTVGGGNLGYIYSFVGRILSEENALLIERLDYLRSTDTQTVDGAAYPVWPGGDVPVSFIWEPTVYTLSDGQHAVRALFTPQRYGDTPVYAVEGSYAFADGSPGRFARLYFRDGVLSEIFGYTGQGGLGAPRQITPQDGDTFTVLERGRKLVGGAPGESFTRPGGTVTLGGAPLRLVQTPAPSGSYVVGFIAEDLDGGRSEQYEALFVQNEQAAPVAGFSSYTNTALGFAWLYPKGWSAETDVPGQTVTFGDDASKAFAFVVRKGYADQPTGSAANDRAVDDVMAELAPGGDLRQVQFAAASADFSLGAFPARRRDFTFRFDGQPYRGVIAAVTPVRGATYAVVLLAPEAGYAAAQASFAPMLESFDILLSGALKQSAGAPPPAFARTTFRDPFDDPKSGLETWRETWGRGGYAAGRYTFELQANAGPEYDYYADQQLPADFMVQATASYSRAADNGYGLIFRVTDNEDFYIFRISGDGFFTAERTDGEDIVTLIDWAESSQIKTQPGAANLLTVVGRGDAYTLYVNGQAVGSFRDAKYRTGTFGVIADNFDEQAGTTVSFDEYHVGAPGQ